MTAPTAASNQSLAHYPLTGVKDSGFLLEAGVTFSWNPLNPPARSRLAFQISLDTYEVDMDVDADRDGTVEDVEDDNGEEAWSMARGAFVPVNQWLTNNVSLAALPDDTITSLAPVKIKKIGPLPPQWTVNLALSNNTDVVLVATNGMASGVISAFATGPGVQAIPQQWVMNGPLTLFAGATEDLSHFTNKTDSVAYITVTINDENGVEVDRDVVALQVAPIILAWNSLPLERLYCTTTFPVNITTAPQSRYPNHCGQTRWVQDLMELSGSAISTNTTLDQVVDLQHGAECGYIENDMVVEGWTNGLPRWHKAIWPNDGNGGNIEVFPPYSVNMATNYPFGRAVMGSHSTGALLPLERQGLQYPIVLPLDWLAVGHIDEVFCFLNDAEVVVGDPALAWQQIIEITNDDSPTYPHIRIGTDNTATYYDAMQNVTNNVNFFFRQTLPVEHPIGIVDSTIEVTPGVGTYDIDDYLLVGREVMLVTNITTSIITNITTITTNTVLWVDRHQDYGSVNLHHGTGAKIRRLSDQIIDNVYANGAGVTPLAKRIEHLSEQLQQKLGKNVVFKRVPVVFGRDYHPVTGVFQGWVAASANMVNCVVDGNTIYPTNPGNERFRQLFHNAVNHTIKFSPENSADDIAAWNHYHINMGELHCGSNTKRAFSGPTFPGQPWWDLPTFNTWGGTAP